MKVGGIFNKTGFESNHQIQVNGRFRVPKVAWQIIHLISSNSQLHLITIDIYRLYSCIPSNLRMWHENHDRSLLDHGQQPLHGQGQLFDAAHKASMTLQFSHLPNMNEHEQIIAVAHVLMTAT